MATHDNSILISILGPDRVGLIAEVAGELYGLGANLADASFAVLGRACEFSCVAELPAGVAMEEVEESLRRLRSLEEAQIRVSPFPFSGDPGDLADVSHVIEIDGGDRPGLIARLSEVFMQFGANVVRMNSRRILD
ncbi:MAG TPA: ACT domain-containing protein, partial [Sphingomonadales bacterium]